MIILQMKKKSVIKIKKHVIYAKKGFAMIKNKERFINYIEKLDIIVILHENLEEVLIAFVI